MYIKQIRNGTLVNAELFIFSKIPGKFGNYLATHEVNLKVYKTVNLLFILQVVLTLSSLLDVVFSRYRCQ